MRSKSIKGIAVADIQLALQSATADGFTPTLAILFASIQQDRPAISKIFTDRDIVIFGATTNGSFTSEIVDTQGAAILLLEINRDYFTVYFEEYPAKNFREVANSIAKKAVKLFPNPAFFIAGSHIETDAEQLLIGFEDVIGKDINIFGCMAGDGFTFSQQFIFTKDAESDRGVVTLVFDQDKVKIKGRALCGWKPVGTVRTVTKSEGNHVFTVDDIPVVDLTAKYGGLTLTADTQISIQEIAAQLPLQLQRDAGDAVMRPGLMIDWSDRSFYCSGSVPQGSKVRFSLPPDFDVVEKIIAGCEDLKTTEMPEADALIVFSCAGRLAAFGPLITSEIEGLQNVWNVPMVGIFSNAELARATGGKLEMHNLTTCFIAIKEI